MPDPQPVAPPRLPQFYWLWAPLNFADRFMLYHNNADAERQAVEHRIGDGRHWAMRAPVHMASCRVGNRIQIRHAACQARDHQRARSGRRRMARRAEPQFNFYMSGIGYGHPEWGHGMYKGENALGYDTYELGEGQPDGPALPACAGFRRAHA